MENNMEKIKTLRQRHGLSQEELAERSGLSLRTIQRIENGETEPRGDSLKRVSAALDVTPNDIMEWAMQNNDRLLSNLNLSALAGLIFPLLGIVVPYILWNDIKDTVKGARHTGKEIINFQITWIILHIVFWAMVFLVLRKAVFVVIMLNILLFWFNLIQILVNQWRIGKGKAVRYFPKIAFLK